MNRMKSTLAAIMVSSTALVAPAIAQTVDVQQYWTSASEAAAMNVIADAFRAEGGTWIDSPGSTPEGNIAAATTRIAGGDAPSAILMTPTSVLTELAQGGLLRDLMPEAEAGGWQSVLPPIVWDKLVVDGQLVALPLGIHSTNWVWYNKAIFTELGIEEPKSFDELFAAADKIQEAGYIGIAVGGDRSSQAQVLYSILLGFGGPDYWNQLFIERSEEALTSDILPKVFDYFRKASTFADAGSASRGWNDTTNMVITKQAGMQFLGDWAKGEFVAAGQVAGTDFGCFLSPGAAPAYAVLVDIFSFPLTSDEEFASGQTILADVLMDPTVEENIAAQKGSVPARSDVNLENLDACAAVGSQTLATPGAPVTAIYNIISNDAAGELTDLATTFWADQTMTTEQAVESFVNTLRSL